MATERYGVQGNLRNNENVFTQKTSKLPAARFGASRTAFSNISNLQKTRETIGKKKESVNLKGFPTKTSKAVSQSSGLIREKKTKVWNEPIINNQEDEFDEEEEIVMSEDECDELSKFENLTVDDIDQEDLSNPTLCADYVKDIYKYMRRLEKRLLPGDYLIRQTEVTRKMRSILVDWLIQVQCRFNLLQETLYLTIYIIDRFLNEYMVTRAELQLVGVTAMLIASKYEEMYAPEIGDFVYITDNAYSKSKIRSMEQRMLKACDYDFSNPLCIHFLRRISKAGAVDAKKHTLAKFLMELTVVDYNFSLRLPSQIAAAALYLSLKLIDNSEWTDTLHFYSEYSEKELKPIVAEMATLVLSIDTSKYQAVNTKYSSNKFLKISKLPQLSGDAIHRYANARR